MKLNTLILLLFIPLGLALTIGCSTFSLIPDSSPPDSSPPENKELYKYSVESSLISGGESFTFIWDLKAGPYYKQYMTYPHGNSITRTEFLDLYRPKILLPESCLENVGGSSSGGGGGISWTYYIECSGEVYSSFSKYVSKVENNLNKGQFSLPFDVVNIAVTYDTVFFVPLDARGLGVEAKPNRKTEPNVEYEVAVYDQEGESRGISYVEWNQPELNVGTQKLIAGYHLNSDEISAYAPEGPLGEGYDLQKFFKVGSKHIDLDIDSEEVHDWIENNVPIVLVDTTFPEGLSLSTPTPDPTIEARFKRPEPTPRP